MNAFKQLGLEDHLVQAITDLGFETPSEVQEKTIPILLDRRQRSRCFGTNRNW